MGCIYSKCMETKKQDEEPAADHHDSNLSLKRNNSITLNRTGSKPFICDNNTIRLSKIENKEYFNYASDNGRISHLDYESYKTPRLPMITTSNTMLMETSPDEETKNSQPFINYDYSNNTTVFGRLSNLDDRNFEGNFDNSFDTSFVGTDYIKPISDDYLSMSSNSILTDNSRLELNYDNDDISECQNILTRKNYLIIHFELYYYMLWGADYIKSVYPENNLVLFVQINDDITTTEKIYLAKSEEKSKFKPMLKKEDIDKNCYRVLKFLLDERSNNPQGGFDNRIKKPIKLSIEICVYSNNKISSISLEEYFFSSHSDTEMHKYQFYPNTYMKYNNKKMGNLFFTFMFKTDRMNFLEFDHRELCTKYLSLFNKKDRLITFKEDSSLQLKYNNIENCNVKNVTPGGGNVYNSFNSLKDIQVVEITSYLKNENITIDKLLELMSTDYITKYELFDIMKKLADFLCKKEFNEQKLIIFKEKLFKLLEEITENNDNMDKITIPYIFNILRRIFFKANKIPAKDKNRKKESTPQHSVRDIELIINIFNLSFNFIRPELGPEISLSALNYINKNIEENIVMSAPSDKKKVTSDEYFINLIVNKKKYNELCDLLLYMSSNPGCALPITSIIMKIIKSKKDDSKDLIAIIKQDRFKEALKEILKTHDCNSLIMTNVFCILYHILNSIELDELFQIVSFSKMKDVFIMFKLNGFDLVHEAIIYLTKAVLVKNSTLSQKTNSPNNLLVDEDYSEMIIIFAAAITYIRNKLLLINDFNRLIKSLFSLLTHIYTICNIINNININNAVKAHKVCVDKKMAELLVDFFNTLNERKVFTCLDNGFDKFDLQSVNTKMIIFRTLVHYFLLLQTLKNIESKTITKISAEKMYKIIKIIEDNDSIYNPEDVYKQYEKLNKKVDDNYKSSCKNLSEYYKRYKEKMPEILKELISIIKK